MRCVLCLLLLALIANAANPSILSRVADSFVTKGYIRTDPFELSPLQLQKAVHEQPLDADSVAAEFAADIARSSHPSDDDLQSLIEKDSELSPDEQLQALRAEVDKLEEEQPVMLEADAEKKGFFGALKRVGGALFRGAKRAGKALVGGAKKLLGKKGGGADRAKAQRLEDCVACRFIWKQVEMDVSNARYVEDVQASFEHNCLDAQKSTIFFKACEDMYDDMYALTDDYMSNDYTVDTMCKRANMCKNRMNRAGQKGF